MIKLRLIEVMREKKNIVYNWDNCIWFVLAQNLQENNEKILVYHPYQENSEILF